MSNKKQTSLDWLYGQIDNSDMGEVPMWVYSFIEQAKEMHKEQIIDAYDKGEWNQGCNGDAEQYYKETYEV
jgi:hypothetical protein